ncbi:MAG: transcriptional regulator, TetR family [Ilumatobacteraceae bacterium]|nr:transcriptional regulator, TetR family [Ilumatobacteraceae bacterium]
MSATPEHAPEPAPSVRDGILAAAIEILHAHGAGGLTVRSVATAAGCSTTGVYTWFGGKNGLVEAIFVDGFERFGAALRHARSTSKDIAVDGMANAYREWAIANPTHYMVMFGRAVPDFRPSPDALTTALGTFVQLVDATSAAMHRLGVPGDANEIAHHLWAGMHGYVSLEVADMDITDDAAVRQRRFDDGVRHLVSSWLPPSPGRGGGSPRRRGASAPGT